MRRHAVLVFLAVATIPACAAPATDVATPSSSTSFPSDRPAGNASEPSAAARDTGTVVRVVDGDTLHVAIDGRRVKIRLIGVDTPETVHPRTGVQCFGPEASAYAKKILAGKRVRLAYDVDPVDRYGRTLAYVYVGDVFVNLDLVARGYATVLTVPPNVAHVDELVRAQRRARTEGRGLWRACG